MTRETVQIEHLEDPALMAAQVAATSSGVCTIADSFGWNPVAPEIPALSIAGLEWLEKAALAGKLVCVSLEILERAAESELPATANWWVYFGLKVYGHKIPFYLGLEDPDRRWLETALRHREVIVIWPSGHYFQASDQRYRRRTIRLPVKVGRNDACTCGSGKKYKRCHGE